jgi:hypothetical protein
MEKRTGRGAEYPPELRNGEWEYQDFTADRKANDKVNLAACFGGKIGRVPSRRDV